MNPDNSAGRPREGRMSFPNVVRCARDLFARSATASFRHVWRVLRSTARAWSGLRPTQQVVVGFVIYAFLGTLTLGLPWSQKADAPWLDHVFIATSALSTTGLTTISIADSYTFVGQFVVLVLFQIGGIGYMTLSSIIILARRKSLTSAQTGLLRAGFSLPHYFIPQRFLLHVVVFTILIEFTGSLVLWWRFSCLGVSDPLWSAVFHAVSAFATAGFSLNNNSLEAFADDAIVQLTIGSLSMFGAVGFIVMQDVWYSIRLRERMLTFTSRIILLFSSVILGAFTLFIYFVEPAVRSLPIDERMLASFFQAMTASTTAGFNTVPIAGLGKATLVVMMVVMIIGASPSGTGGGIKTTSVSALLAVMLSGLRGRTAIALLKHEIPMQRVVNAVAAATVYICLLVVGLMLLCLSERQEFLSLVFEAVSAIGTVGLSMGATSDLSITGKCIIVSLMFAGRCGPLTIGLALLQREDALKNLRRDDLAV
ncbi:MAG: hypothetical protein KF866_05480 [Phycisphaeraceae bacterium]|nr:hypothetical protein [Phycisphaeraceae bacterium]MCW5754444.1 hypothetical protein [Phycisphaeraceae bacterium]